MVLSHNTNTQLEVSMMTSVSYPVSVSTSSSSSVVTQERVSTPTSPYTPPLAEPIEHQPPSIVASIQSNSEINRMAIPTTIDFGAMRTNTLILPTTCKSGPLRLKMMLFTKESYR